MHKHVEIKIQVVLESIYNWISMNTDELLAVYYDFDEFIVSKILIF